MTSETARPSRRPGIHDLPIPDDVQVDATWSKIMIELADFLGPRDALRICDLIGGIHIRRVPRNPRADARLVERLGPDLARRFCEAFAGATLDVPTGAKTLKRVRIRPILQKIRAGEMSIMEAALLTRLPRVCISGFLAKGYDLAPGELPKRDDRQMNLFAPPAEPKKTAAER